MEIGHVNSVITVFRKRMLPCHIWKLEAIVVCACRRGNRCLCAVGVEYRYYQGLHSIPDPTFCAVNCTTRHLLSSDLNKSCRPGLLVLVSYIKCLKSMYNSCTHLSTVTIYPKVIIVRVKYIILFLKHGTRERS